MAGKASNGGISKKATSTYNGTSRNDIITSNADTVIASGSVWNFENV